MTSTQSRYAVISTSPGMESVLVADEWRFLAQSSLESTKRPRPVSRAAIVGLGIVLGTGAISPAPGNPVTSFGPSLQCYVSASKPKKQFSLLDTREQILAIRSILGLNISELAAILGVQRPTIYSWQTGSADPHADNANRLRRIYEAAIRWGRLCTEPVGEWVRRPLDDTGQTLASLLSESTPNEASISEAYEILKVRIEQETTTFAGVADRARKFGYKDRSKGRLDASANRETLV